MPLASEYTLFTKIRSHPQAAVLFFLLRVLPIGSGEAFASDEIEEALSSEIGHVTKVKFREDFPQKDHAYLYFLIAVYQHDIRAREKAEEIYRRLNTPGSRAFLGSIEILKARDVAAGEIFKGMIHLFTRFGSVQRGTEQLDREVREHPDDLDVRIVRAITYLELPSVFGKFRDGFQDMKTILQWLKEGKAKVPDEEELFRDRTSIYYYAGRYFLKMGQADQAKEMFRKSSESSRRSPFAIAAKRRLGGH